MWLKLGMNAALLSPDPKPQSAGNEVERQRKAFERIDTDASGSITNAEFASFLRSISDSETDFVSSNDMEQWLTEIDQDNDGLLLTCTMA